MNILVLALSDDYNLISDVLEVTNPEPSFYSPYSDEFINFRIKHHLEKVDELWLLDFDGNIDFLQLKMISEVKIRVFKLHKTDLKNKVTRIAGMKNLAYQVILKAWEEANLLYVSSQIGIELGIVQEAASVFGCDALYILDENYPVMIKECVPPSLLVCADEDRIDSQMFPITAGDYKESEDNNVFRCEIPNSSKLVDEINLRLRQSKHLYLNYYGMIKNSRVEREVFRKLYYLSNEKIKKIKEYKIGENPEKDWWIINHLPKAELHSHIGGLLDPDEIVEVAKKALNHVDKETQNPNEKEFRDKMVEITKFQDNPKDFEYSIYGDFLNKESFRSIGIDTYQRLGDYQGSSLLQLKITIAATLDNYAKHLIKENVRYVEIRCSPYKYTKLGLSIDEVVETMIATLNKYSLCFEYRLIYIIGRQANQKEIQQAIKDYCRLYDTNLEFKKKFVGVDVAGNEGATKPSALRGDFMPLLEKCAKITIHAGETEDVTSIWEAVYHLSADRIGHGLKLKDSEQLLDRFVDKKIGVEMCPSSNDQIVGFEVGEYPLLYYIQKGLRVTVNTDNCGISRTSLTNEYIKAAELCPGLTLWDCLVLIRNALCIAFCDQKSKDMLMHSFEDEILDLLNEIFS